MTKRLGATDENRLRAERHLGQLLIAFSKEERMISKPVVVAAHTDAEIMAQLDRLIARPPTQSRIFEITPNVALYILDRYNEQNRPIKKVNIARYAEHMAAGTWALTGDTIKFSDGGLLRDGQNRLKACVRSGKPFTTHVIFGINDDFFALLDQGKNRDGSDILATAGYANTGMLSAAVRWAYLVDEKLVKRRLGLEPKETLRLLRDRYMNLETFTSDARAIAKLWKQPAGMVCGFLYHFDKANHVKAGEFAEGWSSGQQGGQFAPIGKMQKRLTQMDQQSSGRINDVVRAALIVTAWNMFVSGRSSRLTDFGWGPEQDFPEIMK
jgi:hypothetical protein